MTVSTDGHETASFAPYFFILRGILSGQFNFLIRHALSQLHAAFRLDTVARHSLHFSFLTPLRRRNPSSNRPED